METPRWAQRPAWADAVLAEVDRAFVDTGADTPGWPDPHAAYWPEGPPESAYSVCADPGKYRILGARIAAWGKALERLGVATVVTSAAPATPWLGAVRAPDDVREVTAIAPVRGDGLTVYFATSLVDGEAFGVDVGVGGGDRPVVFLQGVPHCGCDACDDGSAPELEAIDDAVLTVARGGVVHARDRRSSITAGIDAWGGSGRAPELWLDADRPVRDSVVRWVGSPWMPA